MPAARKIKEWTPVTPRRTGGLVHATALATAGKTLCNKECDGWVVISSLLTCPDCKKVVHLRVGGKR